MKEPGRSIGQIGDTDPAPSLWERWRLPGLVAVAAVTVAVVLFAALGSILPLIVSIILAELLFPIVSYIETHLPGYRRYPSAARLVSIAIVYLVSFAAVAFLIYITFQPIVEEARHFIEDAPRLFESAKATFDEWSEELNRQVPEEVQGQVEEWLRSAGGVVGGAALNILNKTISRVTSTISILFGLVVVPVLLFYMLKDKEGLSGGMYSALPDGVARHTRNVLGLAHEVIGSYVRAQLISASIVGGGVFLGLFLLDVDFAITLGLLAGVLGLIPIIGAILGAVPGLLVVLATDPSKLIWAALVYIVVQFIESNIISPRVQGRALRLHPIVIMTTLVIASDIFGLWGMLIGVPLVAIARDTFTYFYREWGGANSAVGSAEVAVETGAPDAPAESDEAESSCTTPRS